MEADVNRPGKGGKFFWAIIIVIIVVAAYLWWTDKLGISSTVVSTASNAYQAVFLTNNQVYFGKLEKADSQYPILREVYYLQVSQTLQPKGKDTPPPQEILLVKLGGELHGPKDEMVINRDHIVFYEDLKDDSPIVVRIKQNKEGQR